MAVTMTGDYVGGLKCELTHEPSGAKLRTAAPVDNQGDGSSFSPTDLVGAAMGACMLTTMAILAERKGIDLSGASFRVEKHMQSDPRRIAALPVTLHLPARLSAEERQLMERAAHTCPVHRSLLPEIDKSVAFVYDR
jgi:putative redox protein